MRYINYSKKFIRQYKKIPRNIKELAKQKELLFRYDPHNPFLKIHKLHGRQKNVWSFSINYEYRILFEFLEHDEILFLQIGKHEIYE